MSSAGPSPRRGARASVALTAVALALAWPATGAAQTVRAQTLTLGKGTQFRRGDFSIEAQRQFTQGLAVWAWNAAPGLPGTTDLHVAARYENDFGIRAEDFGDPAVEIERSRFLLDIANARYRPVDAIHLTLGRQWVLSSLGVRDVDGIRLRVEPELAPGLDAHVDAFAGFEVASGHETINSDAWDVQGLPIDPAGASPGGRRFGGAAGLTWVDAAFELAWQRSQRGDEESREVGDERVGAAIRGNVSRRLVLSSQAAYNLVLEDVDRAVLDLAWRAPWSEAVVSGGIEHRQPWFDASSIFNVFGARPFEGAHLVYQHPVRIIATTFEARGWARAYDGNLDLADFGAGEGDSRAFGGAVGHDTRFRAFGVPFEWRTFGSVQSTVEGGQGGEQWVGDVRFRFPAIPRRLFMTGRALGLVVQPGSTASRTEGGSAVTGAVTAELPVTFGTFSVTVDGTRSSFFVPNLNAWASFGTELWL